MNQNKDTIRIKSTKDYEWEAGDSFTITLAANSLEGNKDPFKEYSIFDFDLADRLYFEPITFEDIMNIINFEKPDGVLVQFGGQTPLKIANQLASAGVKIYGTSSDLSLIHI